MPFVGQPTVRCQTLTIPSESKKFNPKADLWFLNVLYTFSFSHVTLCHTPVPF